MCPGIIEASSFLAALQWVADRAGLSYGVFTQRLKPVDKTRIQEEFEQYRREHLAELHTVVGGI